MPEEKRLPATELSDVGEEWVPPAHWCQKCLADPSEEQGRHFIDTCVSDACALKKERPPAEQDAALRDAVLTAYLGLIVLKAMLRKADLAGGVEVTDSTLKRLAAAMPELPALSALRTPVASLRQAGIEANSAASLD